MTDSKKNNKNEWGNPSSVGRPINTVNSETFPSISPDGKKLFYTSTKVAGDSAKCSKILMTQLDDRDNWSKPFEVGTPINMACDKSPRLLYDNKTLVYASNKEGHYDLFQTQLGEANALSQPIALEYINSKE